MDAVFEVCDRVECLVDHPDNNVDIVIGSLGTVCEIREGMDMSIGVCWDTEIEGGHDCGGNCDMGYGWRVYPDQIGLYQDPNDDPFEFDEQSLQNLLFG